LFLAQILLSSNSLILPISIALAALFGDSIGALGVVVEVVVVVELVEVVVFGAGEEVVNSGLPHPQQIRLAIAVIKLSRI
jgi:hypothetical protein